eukprot:COSAG01_NODE_513_length_16049_cov_57.758056_14_plen_63_part_00
MPAAGAMCDVRGAAPAVKKGRGVHAPAYATLYSYDTHRGRVRPAWGHPNVIPGSAPRYWQRM